MNRKICILFLICSSIFSASCEVSREKDEYEVFPGAKNVKKIFLKKEAATQVTYEVEKKFPDISVKEFYERNLNKNGWVSCDIEEGWDIRFKNDGIKNKAIRQFIYYSTHHKKQKLLMLNLQYYSKEVTGFNENLVWNDNNQYVTLISYNTGDLGRVINALNITCGE